MKGNSTFSRCSGLKEFRNALVAVTTDLVCAADVLCDEALVAKYVLSAKTANAGIQTKIFLMPPLIMLRPVASTLRPFDLRHL
jgi:hypothetical protein